MDLEIFEKKIFSQNGEDGITMKLIELIYNGNNLQFKNLGDITKIYKPAKYGPGPNGGHRQDRHSRRFISFEEAINV